jgi:hypothetical protein
MGKRTQDTRQISAAFEVAKETRSIMLRLKVSIRSASSSDVLCRTEDYLRQFERACRMKLTVGIIHELIHKFFVSWLFKTASVLRQIWFWITRK